MKRRYTLLLNPVLATEGQINEALKHAQDELVTQATAEGATSLGLFTMTRSFTDDEIIVELDAEVPDAARA